MISDFISTLWQASLDLLIPPRCEVCGVLQEPVVCDRCRAQFELVRQPFCQQCGLPLDPMAHSAGHCVECRDDPPAFDAARAAGLYGGALRRAVHVFKYEMVRALAQPLGEFAADHIELPFEIDCICPVPLHPARERMRGFNQSLLIAEHLAARWNLPMKADLLIRTQNTTPQMMLPREQRRTNVKGAFSSPASLKGRAVCLVDDVFTTGSTLRECSRVLKRAGAGRVLVITLARTVHDL